MRGNGGSMVKSVVKLFMTAVMVGVCLVPVDPWLCTAGAHDDTSPYATMKKGTIQGISDRSLRINMDEFGIAEMVEITDQYRRPVLLKDLGPGQDVFFRADNKKRINKIVLLIPS